jgi:hypothetical protein
MGRVGHECRERCALPQDLGAPRAERRPREAVPEPGDWVLKCGEGVLDRARGRCAIAAKPCFHRGALANATDFGRIGVGRQSEE